MKSASFLLPVLIIASAISGGCATSPVQPGPSARGTGSHIAVSTLGVAGGALVGQSVSSSKYAAPIGASVGLVTAQVANSGLDKKSSQAVAEAKEEGRREARLEVMNQFWYDKTTSYRSQSATQPAGANQPTGQSPVGPQNQTTTYDAGAYDGVNMLPHTETIPVSR